MRALTLVLLSAMMIFACRNRGSSFYLLANLIAESSSSFYVFILSMVFDCYSYLLGPKGTRPPELRLPALKKDRLIVSLFISTMS